MFPPQRKAWTTASSFTPHRRGATTATSNLLKGKGVAFADEPPPPPPLGSLTGSNREEVAAVGFDAGRVEDWRKFREVGLLDEAVLERKDQEALFERVSRLEQELFDYQHNMGLLLIEKKEWILKFDQLKQELTETEEILKREQSAHLIALSEVEKREENLRKALITEKQCGADLERALRAMQGEQAQVQSYSQTNLSQASALVDGIEEKSSVVNKKLHDAEYKLAEVNRNSAKLDMKLRELEVRESMLNKERLSVATDRESFEATFYKQREDLKEWERKLRQREDMLCNGKQNLGKREEKAIETEKIWKQKERELEVLQKNIDSSNSILEKKKAEISRRLADLDAREKKADSAKSLLDVKEKELLALELKLSAREKEGIQKVLKEQKDMLDLKLRQYELEMEEKRKSLIEEFRSKEEDLEQREAEINHREKKVEKEEQGLSKKAERIKEQSKELEAKLKSFKEKEKSMKVKEKELEKEKQQLLADVENMKNLNAELVKIKAEVSQQKLQICQESENLKLTEDERAEHFRLQLELKQEIEHTRLQKDSLMKEVESLREERQRFEKEWEVLDEKRDEISRAQCEIDLEKEKLRKLQHNEEERFKRERKYMQDHLKKELEKLELDKESFKDSMKQEELHLSEKVKNEKLQMLQDFEWRTKNLEHEIHKRQEDMENDLRERERKFQEEMEREINKINVLKDVAEKEWEEVKSEGLRLENERKELESNKQLLKSGQREMHEDSEMLMNLSQKVKKERECLVAERNHFLAFVERLKSCKDCGEVVGGFAVSDLQLPECKERKVIPSHISPVLNDMKPKNIWDNVAYSDLNHSGSVRSVSWLRKCTSKIFNLSPSKRTDGICASDMTATMPPSDVNVISENVVGPASSLRNTGGARVIFEEQLASGAHHSMVTPQLQSESTLRKMDGDYSLSMDDHSYMDSLVDGGPDDSQQSVPNHSQRRPGRRGKSGIARTCSVKAVVEEAKEYLGKASVDIENVSLQSLDTDRFIEDGREDSSYTDKGIGKTRRKRRHAENSRITESKQNAGDSDGQSDSTTVGGRRRKRQTVAPPVQVTGEKRYNLRRHKTAVTVASMQGLSDGTKSLEKEVADGKMESDRNPKFVAGPSVAVVDDDVQTTSLVQVQTAKTVAISDERVVRFDVPSDIVDDNCTVTNSIDHLEENGILEYGYEDGSTIHEVENVNGEGEGEEEEEEEEEHPGEVSFGKKIFRFFTT